MLLFLSFHKRLLLVYIPVAIIYYLVAYQSTGFDNEFFNAELVERYGFTSILLSQAGDIHPPIQIIFNSFFYYIFGNWQAVRVISATFIILAFIYFIENKYRELNWYKDIQLWLIFCGLLMLSPLFLMFATGIRWTSYFLPVYLWLLVLPKNNLKYTYWLKCYFGLFLLAFIGYIAILLAPAIYIYYWLNQPVKPIDKTKQSLLLSIPFILAYIPQLIVLFEVHIVGGRGEANASFNPLISLIGLYVGLASNHGLFPLTITSFISAIGTLTAMSITWFSKPFKSHLKDATLITYIAILLLLLSTGILGVVGGWNNVMFAVPFQVLWLCNQKLYGTYRKFLIISCCMIIFANIVGCINVLIRTNTVKNNWNIPVSRVIDELENTKQQCSNDLAVLVFERTIARNLLTNNFENIISPYIYPNETNRIKQQYQCLVYIKTFTGSLKPYSQHNDLVFDSSQAKVLKKDAYYKIKQKLRSDFPEAIVTMTTYYGVKNAHILLDSMQYSSVPNAKQVEILKRYQIPIQP